MMKLKFKRYAKIHQLNMIKITKKDYRKGIVKHIKLSLKEKETKSVIMVVNDTEILHKMKKKV